MTKYEKLKTGALKRKDKRILGLFIDGTALDRATRRLQRKVDLTRLVKGLSAGLEPAVARYYTLIPYEDDARQQAFLDAVQRAGLDVVVKRLPPRGVTRHVTVDTEMGADIVAFALGKLTFSDLYAHSSAPTPAIKGTALRPPMPQRGEQMENKKGDTLPDEISVSNVKRLLTIVCPSRDLAYPIALAREFGADTATADFGEFAGSDILKSAAKWIDLSNSETIWRD